MSCSMWADERRVLSVVARELRVMGPAMVTRPSRWREANFFEANAGNLSTKRVLLAKTWEKSDQLLIRDCIFGNC